MSDSTKYCHFASLHQHCQPLPVYIREQQLQFIINAPELTSEKKNLQNGNGTKKQQNEKILKLHNRDPEKENLQKKKFKTSVSDISIRQKKINKPRPPSHLHRSRRRRLEKPKKKSQVSS